MKVRLLTALAGPSGVCEAGSILDMARSEALRMIDRGYAQPVRRRSIETTDAHVSAVEKATVR